MAILSMLDGYFIDVKTGEGKTIVIGAYCLIAEKPIHVITVNNYLAEEAVRQLGGIYSSFGISFGVLSEDDFMSSADMTSDIIYGTAASFAFKYIVKRYQRDINYKLNTAVVDEADYVLIDNATSAFSVGISDGEVDVSAYDRYLLLANFVEVIHEMFARADIIELNYDEVQEWNSLENTLTNTVFINKTLKFIDFTQDIQDYVLNISQDYDLEPSEALAFMYGIVNAYYIYRKNIDYVVKDNKIILVDRHNGRLLPNSKHDMYLNLSLLLKETAFQPEQTKNIGKIANQVYFLKYENVIGLSGSLLPVTDEISNIFNTSVIEIPKNKPSKINKKYHFVKDKNKELLNIIKQNIENEKATLIICKSDKDAENVSTFLISQNFEVTLFNNTIEESIKEEDVVSSAGENKKITVSTLLFGRGTDITPDNDDTVLSVIMYEEFGCERANTQITGRTGRQGRDGDTHILVALDDEIFDCIYCKEKANINKKNFQSAIKKAITNLYNKEKTKRKQATYFAYYLDMIFEYYYTKIKKETMDDYFLSKMEDIELLSLNTSKKEETSKLMMSEAKKIIDTIQYCNKK